MAHFFAAAIYSFAATRLRFVGHRLAGEAPALTVDVSAASDLTFNSPKWRLETARAAGNRGKKYTHAGSVLGRRQRVQQDMQGQQHKTEANRHPAQVVGGCATA
jgi:hypothetical protein